MTCSLCRRGYKVVRRRQRFETSIWNRARKAWDYLGLFLTEAEAHGAGKRARATRDAERANGGRC